MEKPVSLKPEHIRDEKVKVWFLFTPCILLQYCNFANYFYVVQFGLWNVAECTSYVFYHLSVVLRKSFCIISGSAICELYQVWRGSPWTIWWLQGWPYSAWWFKYTNFCLSCTSGTQWKMGRYLSSICIQLQTIWLA
jgi:hypothetical protein